MPDEGPDSSDISMEIDRLLSDISADPDAPDDEIAQPTNEAVTANSTAAQILGVLREDARVSKTELADRVGVSVPTVTKYIKQLEAREVILGYSVDVDPGSLRQTTIALVEIDIIRSAAEETIEGISQINSVHSLYTLEDDATVLAEFRTAGFGDLSQILKDDVLATNGVTAARTTVLEERHN